MTSGNSNNNKLSFAAIVVIAANTMNGPGLTTLPAMALSAGQITYVLIVILAALVTCYVAQRLCILMWRTSHKSPTRHPMTHNTSDDEMEREDFLLRSHDSNDDDDDENDGDYYPPNGPVLEETDLVALSGEAWADQQQQQINHPKKNKSSLMAAAHGQHQQRAFRTEAQKTASWAMVGCALALALAQMMLCAKIADAMIVASMGYNCGIGIPTFELHCTESLSMKPFLSPISRESLFRDDKGLSVTRKDNGSSRMKKTQQSPPPGKRILQTTHMNVEDEFSNQRQLAADIQDETPPMCLITVGLIIAAAITVSMASVDQSAMITAQFVLFGCLLLACVQFCATMGESAEQCLAANKGNKKAHLAGDHEAKAILGPRPLDAIGPVLFNFAYIVTAPPLSAGAQEGMTGAVQALVTSTILMGWAYVVIGWMGAPVAACVKSGAGGGGGDDDDTNLLSLVLQAPNGESAGPSKLNVAAVIVFGLSQLAAIPVYCELARETLDSHIKIMKPRTSFLACHLAPWAICIITYNSAMFESFVEWSSLLLLGFCNFSLPLLLEIKITASGKRKHMASGHVLWVFSLVSASIGAVISHRITENIIVAELTFMAITIWILNNY